MGGIISKTPHTDTDHTTPTNTIPPLKKYDVVYLTSLLTARSKHSENQNNDEESFKMALAACEALRDVSDSYAYSEEAIAANCVPSLMQLVTQHQDTQFPLQSPDQSQQPSHDKTIDSDISKSKSKELALASVYTILYMLEESSAPQLFGEALIPILQEIPKDDGSRTNLFADEAPGTHKELYEEVRVCLKRVRGLVRCQQGVKMSRNI
jgi:hypothetical protein